ncbi:MAG: hypothetical protein AABX34_05775 [Nanoarchaeota archaeon]
MVVFNNKKSEVITLVLIIVIIAVFLGWLINFNSKECRSNSQCQSGFYCGSDFSCHEMPIIERTLTENNLVMPSIIIGIAIIAAAFVLRAKNSSRDNKSPERSHAPAMNQIRRI